MKQPHPAISALYEIIKKEDWSSFCPEKERKELLEKWLKAWIVDVEFSQPVINKSYLTSEYDDIIKLGLAQKMAEDLAEECTAYTTGTTSISARMCAFRRKEKVRGES